jgi:ABC-2 type transport system permease protein
MAWTAVWFLLGFSLYATLYAAAGSLVSRVEDAQSASGPLMLPIFLGYSTAVGVIGGSDPSLLLRVLAFFPLTAPFDMPVLIALGEVPAWQVAISVALMLGAIVGMAFLGGVVYSRSILRAGKRLRWREALRAPAT